MHRLREEGAVEHLEHMRRAYWMSAGIILGLFVVDRLSRTLAFAHSPRTLIPGLLQSTPTVNRGIALGIPLPEWLTYALIALLLVAVVVIARSAFRQRALTVWIACLTIAGGALSNVLDRLEYGYVRDFLKLSFWPTTANFGDWLITIGTIVLILASMPRRHTRSTTPQL